ncbi:MAG: stalk domain-containing protein [Defluviitaleaceae bacterium]|nr:stalk domain-containing protein [Defluviitaleaceae bacterium]
MKRLLSLTLAFVMILGITMPISAQSSEIAVYIGSRQVQFLDQRPVLTNQLLIPIRPLFEALRFDVAWDNGTVTLTGMNDVFIITIGSNTFMANGEEYSLTTPAQIIGGRAMMDVKPLLDYLDFPYRFDGSSHFDIMFRLPLAVETRSHIVREGDSLSRIAAQFEISIDLIIEANDMTDHSALFVGQVLLIPIPIPITSPPE